MENAVSPFPLLNLPDRIVKKVLQRLDFMEMVVFSLISIKTKELITDLNIQVKLFRVDVESSLYLTVTCNNSLFLEFIFYSENKDDDAKLGEAGLVSFTVIKSIENVLVDGSKTFKWQKKGFDFKDWITHLRSLMHSPRPTSICFTNQEGERFDFTLLEKVLEPIGTLLIEPLPDEFSQKILDVFLSAQDFAVHDRTGGASHRRIYIQNFGTMLLGPSFETTEDELLLMNSRSFKIEKSPHISSKSINRFLKLWIKNSKSRVLYASIILSDDNELDELVVLKGINYRIVQGDSNRMWNKEAEFDAVEIRSRNGVYANIQFGGTDEFSMLV